MKKIKFKTIISLLILIFAFIVSGCEKEDEALPEYIGSWEYELVEGYKIILLELKEKTFKSSFSQINQSGEEVIVSFSIGNIIVDHDSIFFIDNQIFTDTTWFNGSDLIEFNRGTEEFDKRFGEGIRSYGLVVGNDILILSDSEINGIWQLFFGYSIYNRVLK